MNLQNRIDRLERAATPVHDLTLLTDAELIALEKCYSEAEALGISPERLIPPELEAALRRVER